MTLSITTKPFALTMGDPAGIGGELSLKAWQARHDHVLPPFFVLDDVARLQRINPDVPLQIIENPEDARGIFDSALPVINVPLKEPAQAGTINPANGAAVLESIRRAVDFCLNGKTAGVITNPIHKAALYDIGFAHAGHTEFLADLCGGDLTPVMMLAAKDLRVVPLTVHIPLRDVPKAVTADLIIEKTRIIHRAMKADFGLDAPRIAVAGLNPHAGEDGTIGMEDQDVIVPAIKTLQAEGLSVSGPYPADTMFHADVRAHYDVALGMYHDQALIPLKTLDFHGGVNVTLGLPIIRTSPDHGTALNIAGQGTARPDSLINAIKMAAEMTTKREG